MSNGKASSTWFDRLVKASGLGIARGTKAAAIPDLVVTYTTGSAPTPSSALTVANSATPTVVELLAYCADLQAKLQAATAAMKAFGIIS